MRAFLVGRRSFPQIPAKKARPTRARAIAGSVMGASLLLLGVLAPVTGCKEEEPRPPIGDPGNNPGTPGGGSSGSSSGEGGAPTDGGAPDGDAATACTNLEITGGVIDQVAVNGELPAGTGGEIPTGTWDLTDARIYTGPSGFPGLTESSFQGTLIITDGLNIQRAIISQTAGNVRTETRVTGTIITNGANAVVSLTCPFSTQEQVIYTSMGNQLTLSNLVTKESFSFTKKL